MERSPEGRARRRSLRRWKRRLRIAAPYLCIPLLLATLLLSVDLIEVRRDAAEARPPERVQPRTAPEPDRRAELRDALSRASSYGDPLAPGPGAGGLRDPWRIEASDRPAPTALAIDPLATSTGSVPEPRAMGSVDARPSVRPLAER